MGMQSIATLFQVQAIQLSTFSFVSMQGCLPAQVHMQCNTMRCNAFHQGLMQLQPSAVASVLSFVVMLLIAHGHRDHH
jgi:hypothetical protein